MTLATVVGGAFMTLVHSFSAGPLGEADYATFGTMLRVLLFLGIPSAGIQVVFAQQTAATEAGRDGQLAGMARKTLLLLTGGWAVAALAAVFFRSELATALKLADIAILWPTLGAAWVSLILPVFSGLVQGRQDFGALGGVAMVNGFVRLAAIIGLVLLGGGRSTAAMSAACCGLLGATALAAWASRRIWLSPTAAFDGRAFARRILPFTLGAACMLVLSQSDVIFLKAALPGALAGQPDLFQLGTHYLPASTIGFAMTQFTVPLAVVMFPKIARSFARAEKSDALRLALTGTAVIGSLAAIAATVLPKLPLQILYFRSPDNWAAAPMVPWCAWAMLSFALANVVVSDRLARADFRFVPWAVGLTAVFLGTLAWLKPQLGTMAPQAAYRLVVGTIGGFNLALLVLVLAVSRSKRVAGTQ